jgi:hypothetical protein
LLEVSLPQVEIAPGLIGVPEFGVDCNRPGGVRNALAVPFQGNVNLPPRSIRIEKQLLVTTGSLDRIRQVGQRIIELLKLLVAESAPQVVASRARLQPQGFLVVLDGVLPLPAAPVDVCPHAMGAFQLGIQLDCPGQIGQGLPILLQLGIRPASRGIGLSQRRMERDGFAQLRQRALIVAACYALVGAVQAGGGIITCRAGLPERHQTSQAAAYGQPDRCFKDPAGREDRAAVPHIHVMHKPCLPMRLMAKRSRIGSKHASGA